MQRTHANSSALTQMAFMVGMILIVGCAMNLPPTSRSGATHDITIEQELLPAAITAGIGDEVRFVNHRTADVKVVFLEGDLDKVSCQRGFRFMGMMRDSAKIAPGEAASVCFNKPGFYGFTVRMIESVPGGETIHSGKIQVGNVHTDTPKS